MKPARDDAALRAARLREGRRAARALLVEVEGSAPLAEGASMLVDESGRVEGSITGGCVEGAVAQEALRVLGGEPPKRLTYGISDDFAGTVGLACGGTVHVFVSELGPDRRPVEEAALEAVAAGRPVALATLLDGGSAGAELALIDGDPVGSLGSPRLDQAVARDAAALLDQGVTTVRRYGPDGETHGTELGVHVACFAASPQLLIFGAIDFSAALSRIAAEVGYAVTICDPREAFVRSERFARSAEVRVAWPQDVLADRRLGPRDAILVFTHDAKLDEPALLSALRTGAGYIGALGSRRTTADRNRRLLEAGLDEADLARLHAPCGLDIGSSTPEEVAISVLAEIVAERSGRDGAPLRGGAGPIHARRAG